MREADTPQGVQSKVTAHPSLVSQCLDKATRKEQKPESKTEKGPTRRHAHENGTRGRAECRGVKSKKGRNPGDRGPRGGLRKEGKERELSTEKRKRFHRGKI